MKFNVEPLDNFLELITYGFTNPMPDTDSGPWKITAKDIINGRINYSTARKTSEAAYAALTAKSKPQINDILLTKDGTLGRIAIVDRNNICINQSVALLRCNHRILPQYLTYLLQTPKYQAQMIADSDGTTIKHIYITRVNKMVVRVPEIPEQKAILDVLVTLDTKIELNQRINDNLERQAQALFKAWFVDFEPFGGSIPDDWKHINFSDFLAPRIEKSEDPSLPMFSVTDNGIVPRNEKFKKNLSLSKTKSKVIHQTDLVFGMSREILNWGIMRNPIGGVSSAYNVYKVNEQINSFYLESYMKANYSYFKDLIKPASREGQGIDKNALMQKIIVMPTQEVLAQYYSIESALVRTTFHALEEKRQLATIRDTLLPKLMSGKIDVSAAQL